MPQRTHDRVKETTTTTGTGSITLLGAVAQFAAFSDRFVLGEPIYYAIVGQSGTEWETGRGSLTNSTTLSRDAVHESSNRSGVPPNVVDSPVNFSAGTKDVFVTLTGNAIEDYPFKGEALALAMGQALP